MSSGMYISRECILFSPFCTFVLLAFLSTISLIFRSTSNHQIQMKQSSKYEPICELYLSNQTSGKFLAAACNEQLNHSSIVHLMNDHEFTRIRASDPKTNSGFSS